MSEPSKRGFVVRTPARFLKDPAISSNAKALRVVIGAYAEGPAGETYVKPTTLEQILGWGRRRRERAQAELEKAGWLRLKWRRGSHGRWARRIYELCDPSTVARFERSGETAQLISYHSQSQVKSSMTTILTENQIRERPGR
jgi:hypothetical protein